MSGRKRSKSEAKKSAILGAAGDLFLELGFETTSMDKVAQRAGVSKQTVYSHFSNKEALFSAVIEYKCQLYGLSQDMFDADKNCRQNLMTCARQMCHMLSTEEAVRMERLCSSSAAERPDIALLFFRSGPQKIKELLRNYIADQAEAGNLVISDADLAASVFSHTIQADIVSMARWGVSELNEQDTEAYLEVAVDMFMQYYQS